MPSLPKKVEKESLRGDLLRYFSSDPAVCLPISTLAVIYFQVGQFDRSLGAARNELKADVYYGRREEILRRRAKQRLRYSLGCWNQKPKVELKFKP